MFGKYDKKLWIQLMLILFLYTVVGWVISLLFDFYFSSSSREIVRWIQIRMSIIFILYLIIGYVLIFFYYWKKMWKYLEEIMDGMETIYKKDDTVVKLSTPLNEIEERMNHIKMSILSANQAINIAENKKNELVTYLAHDIRTPLTSIIGYLSVMKDMPDMPSEKRQQFVEEIFNKAMHLEKLVNEFFEIAQYNLQQIKINKKEINLEYLFIQLADEFYPILSQKGNTIKFQMEDDMICRVDPEKISRAFGNLLKNAISYSYPCTEILIRAEKNDKKNIIIFSNKGDDISSEKLSKMFEKFCRLDDARASDSEGAGLGLAITKEIILLHGGDIKAESNNGIISFIVHLPV